MRAPVRGGESETAFPAGVEPVVGDLAEPDSLRAAMAGVDRVFLLSGPHRDAVTWPRNATDAAAASEVGLLVRSSIIGADKESPAEFISSHTQCDRYLEQSGLSYAILRPNLFLQNIPESTIPSIGEDGNFYADAGDARTSMVDTRDIAAVAESSSPRMGMRVRTTTSPDRRRSPTKTSRRRCPRRPGRRINYVGVPDDAVRTTLLGLDLDQWFVDPLIGLYQDYPSSGTDGYASAATDAVERLSGRPPRSLDDLLAEMQPPAATPT